MLDVKYKAQTRDLKTLFLTIKLLVKNFSCCKTFTKNVYSYKVYTENQVWGRVESEPSFSHYHNTLCFHSELLL